MAKDIKVMVVDDSLIMRKNITRILEELTYTVVSEAKSGSEAIVNYAQHKPDLVTMDITMPDMDGIEAVKKIKRSHSDARIIMVTAHGQEDMVIKAIKAGARAYVLKPITSAKLEDAINKLFAFKIEKEESSKDFDSIDELDDFAM